MITSPDPGASGPSLDRRTALRRAAAAGIAAWTAPLILDSLASPAAAATIAPNCYRAQFVSSGTGCRTVAREPADNGGGCNPSGWNNAAEFPGTIKVTVSSSPCTYTFEIASGDPCVFDVRSTARQDQGNGCVTGVVSNGCRRLVFTPPFVPDRFKILISCGGVLCAGGAPCTVPLVAGAPLTTDGPSSDRVAPGPPWAGSSSTGPRGR